MLELGWVGEKEGIIQSEGIACHLAIDATQTSDYPTSTPIPPKHPADLCGVAHPLNIEFTKT